MRFRVTVYRRVLATVGAVVLVAATGCASAAETHAATPAPPNPLDVQRRTSLTSFAPPVVSDCRTTSPVEPGQAGIPELEGRASAGEVWALVFHPLPLQAMQETKIVWRVTGLGSLQVGAKDDAGDTARLTFGPEPHIGSDWNRPGDEWGTGFIFPKPGCWRLHVRRDDVSGDVYLQVVRR